MRRLANEGNLIPANKRSKSEHREIAKRGGVASGKARRKKADFQKALKTILSSEVNHDQLAIMLKKMGFDNTNESAIALVTIQKALKGDMRAIELIERSTAQVNKDSLDKAEQKERIKALKLDNQRRELELNDGVNGERLVIVNDIPLED